MRRASLAEHDGLTYRTASARLAHPVDLSRWLENGWIRIDLDGDCFRLTDDGNAEVAGTGRVAIGIAR